MIDLLNLKQMLTYFKMGLGYVALQFVSELRARPPTSSSMQSRAGLSEVAFSLCGMSFSLMAVVSVSREGGRGGGRNGTPVPLNPPNFHSSTDLIFP